MTDPHSATDCGNPLDGVRVIDFTAMLAGPYATMLLADLGAEVVKVEPLTGDAARTFGPFLADDVTKHYGGYFQSTNRNKKSIAIDLRTPAGIEVALALVDSADVVVENFRPGVMDRLGLSWEVLHARKPSLVYACIRGFGDPRTGATPLTDWPAFDLVAQAFGGFMSITGPDATSPMKAGPGIGDIFPATLCTTGLIAALYRADRTGVGAFVEVSMYDSIIALCERIIYQYSYGGEAPQPQGNTHPLLCPFDAFPTSDGWVVIAAPYDSQWRALCEQTGIAQSVEFATLALRNANSPALRVGLSTWTKQRTKAEVMAALGGRVPCAPVNNAEDVFTDTHVAARSMLIRLGHPGSKQEVTVAGSAIKFADAERPPAQSAPTLGQHTEGILQLLGVSAHRIAWLRDTHIVG